jgi:hypothetical protein
VTLALRKEEAEELLAGDALALALLLPEAEEVTALAEPEAALLGEKAEAEAAPEPAVEAEGKEQGGSCWRRWSCSSVSLARRNGAAGQGATGAGRSGAAAGGAGAATRRCQMLLWWWAGHSL